MIEKSRNYNAVGFFCRLDFSLCKTIFLFPIVLLILFVGCTAPAPSAQFVAQAERLHNGALASTIATDPDLNDYFQQVADRIGAAAKAALPNKVSDALISRLRCHLVACDTVNAFTTGGNHLYVYNALFQQCHTEDELAAAIAHAYAHAINLDLEATKMKPDPNRPLPMVAYQFVLFRLTAAQEQEADRLAFTIYSRAGWDPTRFPVLFERLESISGGNVAPDRQPLPMRAAIMRSWFPEASRDWRKLPVADPRTYESLRRGAGNLREPGGTPTPLPLLYLRAFPNCMLSGDTPEQREAQERLKPPPPPPTRLEPS